MRFDPGRVRVSGPLARHAITLGDQLLLATYPPERAVRHVQVLAQLSRWMEDRIMTIKQKALDRTRPRHVKPGRYRPPDPLLAFVTSL